MERKWEELTADEKMAERFHRWLNPAGVAFISSEAEKDYRDRVNRIRDAIQLRKTPDRVPVFPFYTFLPAYLAGISCKDAMYDYDKLVAAWWSYLREYQPDAFFTPGLASSGNVMEIMGYKVFKWPGHGVKEHSPYQCIEAEYMQAKDYPALIDDPSDFWFRTYMPRIMSMLEPLASLPPLTSIMECPSVSRTLIWYGLPEVQKALEAVMEAGREAFKWSQYLFTFHQEAASEGYVNGMGGATKAPFDVIGDTLRGTQGIMMDMFRQPQMLLKAMERITPLMIKSGLSGPNLSGNPLVFIPLHKGSDGFMSDQQFQTFYWPSLKAVIQGLIDEGCVPIVFAEGAFKSRLKYLKELPPGKTVWLFDRTDIFMVKDLLGEVICIAGNIPVSLLITGSVAELEDYGKKLIAEVGKGGGYILSSGVALDEAKAENLKAMFALARRYGVYPL